MKRILFCATVDYHFKAFHLPILRWFKEQSFEVHVAAAGDLKLPFVDKKFNIPIQRSPLSMKNMQAYKELKTLIDQNHYEIIHCHTPMGGVLTRLAAREARGKGTKVLYTAHGFHFCKGAPILNWLIYYPIEKILSFFTDCLITINEEDYNLARNNRFSAGEIKHIYGVGVDTAKYKPVSAEEKHRARDQLGYKKEDFLMFYAAEFNKNKNQKMLIRSVALIKEHVPSVKLLLAGTGPLMGECSNLAEALSVIENVDFLGYRKDVDSILPACDISVSTSFREGLPVNIMEAMACGLPVIATKNRGHKELILNNKTGWLIDNDINLLASKIISIAKSSYLKQKFGITGRQIIVNKYSLQKVLEQNINIYTAYMEGEKKRKWAAQ